MNQHSKESHRLLYGGEFAAVELIGLPAGKVLKNYTPPESLLAIVAFGILSVW